MKSGLIDTARPGPTFDAESMRAILDGRKTQTRRVLPPELASADVDKWTPALCKEKQVWIGHDDRFPQYAKRVELPYRVGGVYYARESLCRDGMFMVYRSDGSAVVRDGNMVRWPSTWKDRPTSSFAMPRWAARVLIRITDVRVQRLGEITADDAIAEGILPNPVQEGTWMDYPPGTSAAGWRDPRRSFESRWNQVNKPGSWERDRNRWVAAYTFEVLKGVA